MSAAFDEAFAALRAIMLEAGQGMVIARDHPGDLELRTPDIDPKTGKPGWFGTVTTKKSYVAYHLVPLYAEPSLADGISPALAKRRQGKTCFNFKAADPALFEEIRVLSERCAAHVRAPG
jgi:hypothetical protein